MSNSAMINLNILDACHKRGIPRIFFSSSACVYPEYNQIDPLNPKCAEDTAYPAAPDSEYGWEKLFCERLYRAYMRNYGIEARIARYHNIFGPEGSWNDGKEKAPAALCRKVAMSKDGTIEIWGDGKQTRSFLFIDECLEGTIRLMRPPVPNPSILALKKWSRSTNWSISLPTSQTGKSRSITSQDLLECGDENQTIGLSRRRWAGHHRKRSAKG